MNYTTTNTWANSNTKMPSAHITVQKNRIKKYDDKFYLHDEQEFEIELFNPTSQEVLAVISLNGNSIGSGGIVIRPGERIYLERYLTTQKRFKFSTYWVENNAEVLDAIAENGNVNIKFYKKQLNNYWFNGCSTITIMNPSIWTSHPIGNNFYNTSGNVNVSSNNTFNYTSTFTSNSNEALPMAGSCSSNSKSLETGRIGQGSDSQQNFEYVNMQFEHFPITTTSFKLLPVSIKPTYSKDLKVAKYCTGCGTRIKENWKFCATCGNKI